MDISIGKDKKSIDWIFRKDNLYYKQNLIIDNDSCMNLPSQGIGGAIFDGYEDYELQTTLRRMQNGKTSKDDFKDLIQKKYEKIVSKYDSDIEKGLIPQYTKRPNVKDVEDEIYHNLIRNAQNNLELQKIELEKLKPSTSEAILWRGVFPDSDLGYGGVIRDVINDKLKPGSTVVIDGATMCTSPNLSIASQYGQEYIRIKAPVGSKLVRGLEEVRFPAKAEFKFIGKTNIQDRTVWDFEYVIPS